MYVTFRFTFTALSWRIQARWSTLWVFKHVKTLLKIWKILHAKNTKNSEMNTSVWIYLCEFAKMLHPPEIQTLSPFGWKPTPHPGKVMLLLEENSHLYIWTLKRKENLFIQCYDHLKHLLLKECYKIKFFYHTHSNDCK